MTKKALDNLIQASSYVSILLFIVSSIIGSRTLYAVFFIWTTSLWGLQAYRAARRRIEENAGCVLTRWEKAAQFFVPGLIALLGAVSLATGVLMLCGVL